MISNTKSRKICRAILLSSVVLTPAVFAGDAAGGSSKQTIGSIATTITESFEGIGKLILSIAFVAGLGFGVAAIFKFKQHKDNPTQVPVGTPVAMLGISAALVFLPSFYDPLGATMGVGTAGGFEGGGASGLPGASTTTKTS